MEYGTIDNLTARTLGFIAGLGLAASTALAQDYGFDWVTVGDPGNRDTRPDEVPQWSELEIGGVDYEYRIARTELTVQQHFEFVQAYWQYLPRGERTKRAFTGQWIGVGGSMDDPQYYIRSGAAKRPADLTWRHAARLANWLHNGKVEEQWAFEDGAYDTSTFGYNDDGTFTDQAERNPDAKFWIPSMDEYAKAMFWDPDKNSGDGGYWMFPHSKDEVPISGAPWEGGETNAGAHPDDFPNLDVGSYPWAASPWGLLDGSGGQREWTETVADSLGDRIWRGSLEYGSFYDLFDRLDYWSATKPDSGFVGVRFATLVPAPATPAVMLLMLSVCCSSRRRRSR